MNVRWISTFVAIASLGLAACAKDDDGGETGATDSAASDSDSAMTMSSSAGTMSATSDTMSTSSGTESTTDTATTTTGAPKGDGESCMMDAECESGQCFVVGVLGGLCGECNEDADCDQWGCSIPNPLSDPPRGAACGDGEIGSGCESDAACNGLICATILDVPGVFTASTCSDCDTDEDCSGEICNPNYDVAELTGNKTCVAAGSVADGQGCAIGSEACTNFCAEADVMGLLTLGVCSGCAGDEDCDTAAGETCEDPVVDLAEGLIAGGCVADAGTGTGG